MSITSVTEVGAGDQRVRGSRHGRFLWRFTVIVVLWSIVGVAVGAALAVLFAWAGIGPGGRQGLVLQMVTWIIFWHLMLGLWAGYGMLADRSHRELAPDRIGGARLSVRCDSHAIAHTRRTLSTFRPLTMQVTAVTNEQQGEHHGDSVSATDSSNGRSA